MNGTTRRGAIAGGITAVVAGAIYEFPRHAVRTLKGPYADLVGQLADPDRAAAVGRVLCAGLPQGCGTVPSVDDLKRRLAAKPLAAVVLDDVRQNYLVEAQGWVLPLTVGRLCVMATKTQTT